eukprot:1179010-Prorocentrum_minimum.AAC.2
MRFVAVYVEKLKSSASSTLIACGNLRPQHINYIINIYTHITKGCMIDVHHYDSLANRGTDSQRSGRAHSPWNNSSVGCLASATRYRQAVGKLSGSRTPRNALSPGGAEVQILVTPSASRSDFWSLPRSTLWSASLLFAKVQAPPAPSARRRCSTAPITSRKTPSGGAGPVAPSSPSGRSPAEDTCRRRIGGGGRRGET